MKKSLALFLFLIIFAPGLVFSNIFTFKVGMFIPRAQYEVRGDNLWWIEFDQMSFVKTTYHDTNFGFGYEYFFSNQFSLVLNIEGYSKNKLGQYEGYVAFEDENRWPWAVSDEYMGDWYPSHTFSVSITPIQLSVKIAPLGRRQKIIPYIGGGIGIYIWSVRLFGEFINFDYDWTQEWEVPVFPIENVDAREENKFQIGYHAFGGIMVPLANRISLEAEFKYQFAKANLKEAFEGFEPFDLSGYQISIGLNYWF